MIIEYDKYDDKNAHVYKYLCSSTTKNYIQVKKINDINKFGVY